MPSSPDHKAPSDEAVTNTDEAEAQLIEEIREAFLDLEHAEFEYQRVAARERCEAAYRAVRRV